jgi:integrase
MKVKTAGRGLHCDGGGLYLQVTVAKDGERLNRSWIFRYRVGGRLRDMGLGPLSTIGLADAREIARKHRAKLLDNIDPIEEKRASRSKPAIRLMTFDQAATAYIAEREDSWKNAIHRAQWRSTIRDYASPIIGKMAVRDIATNHITAILDPIWKDKPETASRLRGRMESILDWAKVRGHRDGENPARWRGHLDHIYTSPSKARKAKHVRVGRDGHHAALPYSEIGSFVAALRERSGSAAHALEFAILTAGRTSEVIGARWNEVDLDAAVWTVPAGRMKAGKEHRVPLSPRALAIVAEMAAIKQSDYVFPGDREGEPLSQMALLMALRRMGRDDLTVHGFRSTFRDWAAERTNFPREVAEMALAHTIGDRVEAAYRRGDLFAKRVRLMHDWAKFCEMKPADRNLKVVSLHADQQ